MCFCDMRLKMFQFKTDFVYIFRNKNWNVLLYNRLGQAFVYVNFFNNTSYKIHFFVFLTYK